jgi:cysteine-rich repeat protein
MLASPTRLSSCVLVALLAACGDDGGSAADESSSSGAQGESTTSTQGEDTSTDDAGPTDTTNGPADTSSETGFDPPTPTCGNGYVEDGEECDDANEVDDDACNNACLLPCGIEWSASHLGPTQDSDIYGLQVGVDGEDGSVAIGFERRIDVDPKGNPTIGEPTAVVVAFDSDGNERWSRVLAEAGLSVTPGDVVVDDAGTAYVALSVEQETGGRDVHVLALDPEGGETIWTHEVVAPAVDGDDVPEGLALAPDGDLVLVATVRVADMNDDAWVRKLATTDGTEVWTETFDGMATGEFSTDNGGPVAVGADGTVYALVQPYVDFSTVPVTLIAYPADGGAPLWTFTPEQGGAAQEFFPVGVAVGDDGSIYLGYERLTSQIEFWFTRLDADGTEIVTFDRDHFIVPDVGGDWRMSGIAYAPDRGPVAFGNYDAGSAADDWVEAWIAQLDPDAEIRCRTTHQADSGGLVPPTIFVNGGAVGVDGGPFVVGEMIDEPESALWIARFRPE